MTRLRPLLAALILAVPALAAAQWQWIDGSGRRVFSDQPPPPEIPASKILKQPGVRASAAPAADPAPAAAAAPAQGTKEVAAAKPAPSGRDKELEARKKQAEAAEAQKRKAEEEAIAKTRAENCTRARQAKATLDSGIRLARVNDKGEREILDDSGRAAEAKRIDQVIASECKPA
ncbi:DUF4124 domain-containing protein [Ramlibacter rhizophilus]|uniref:DUF4124 domain-containing protein n=1 Tax=Ramlibacter rhizophilus TaxID=1781167 RepID=A0A4Z0C088_9BURK|nr:DUF4124 domain-containing protein [Ramlibacter rhizophilus]TFZ04946.1 DUF4124 domain-containing protein [Ramlibacter rhizophilus]